MRLVNECVPPFVPQVGLSNSVKPKFRWLAFPGLIRGIGIIHFFIFVLLVFQWKAIWVFVYDWGKITEGEYWRIFSFLAIPPLTPNPGSFLLILTLFMFFILKITFLMNDTIEEAWGELRTTLYVYASLACIIAANLIFGPIFYGQGGLLFYETMFVAFATICPHYEFRLMLILPVKVGVLAVILGIIILIQCFRGWEVAGHAALSFFPYLIWAVPRFVTWFKARGNTMARQAAYRSKSLPAGAAFHTCAQCNATDATEPDRDFFVADDDRELCNVCLDAQSEKKDAAGDASSN